MVKRSKRNSWGRVDELPSGRYRASYLHRGQLWNPPRRTFATRMDATAYLKAERALIDAETWTPPAQRTEAAKGVTVAEYAAERVAARTLSERTREHYEGLVRLHIASTELGRTALAAVTVDNVEDWHRSLVTGPTARAHAYALLHSVMADAVRTGRRTSNPAVVVGAQNAKSKARIRALTAQQLVTVANAADPAYRAAILLAGTCTLRSGELKGLRRSDVAADGSTVTVNRAVNFRSGRWIVKAPKSDAGVRTIAVPAFVRPTLVAQLDVIGAARGAVFFPGRTGAEYMTDWEFRRAVAEAGRSIGLDGSDDDHKPLRPHELRHTAGTLAAQTGATVKELMSRLGHSTYAMAVRYQQASAERDAHLADKLDAMFTGTN